MYAGTARAQEGGKVSLPYENTTSGEKALDEVRKMLTKFGCNKFGTMTDTEMGEVMVQFEYRGRQVHVKASARGYAAAWLKENPWSYRSKRTQDEHKRRASDQGQIAIYSILRDWIKGQVMAIECGILTFEGAFLGQIFLPSGRTVLEHIQTENLLPAPDNKVIQLGSSK